MSDSQFVLGPNQRKWIDALRSGKYAQQHNSLLAQRQGSAVRYCCLGVLCEIAGVPSKEHPADGVLSFEDEQRLLSKKTQEFAALRSRSGDVDASAFGLYSCTLMNDKRKYTFTEIADAIETNPEAYFERPA